MVVRGVRMFSGSADGADDPEGTALLEVETFCGLTLGSEDPGDLWDAIAGELESHLQSKPSLFLATSGGVNLEVVEEAVDGVCALEGCGFSGKHGCLP